MIWQYDDITIYNDIAIIKIWWYNKIQKFKILQL